MQFSPLTSPLNFQTRRACPKKRQALSYNLSSIIPFSPIQTQPLSPIKMNFSSFHLNEQFPCPKYDAVSFSSSQCKIPLQNRYFLSSLTSPHEKVLPIASMATYSIFPYSFSSQISPVPFFWILILSPNFRYII